jgi:hypothetical protein
MRCVPHRDRQGCFFLHSGKLSEGVLDPLETSNAMQKNRPIESETGNASAESWHPDWGSHGRNPDSVPFEHRGWSKDRRRIYASMCRTEQAGNRRHAFATCRDRVHVMTHPESGEIAVRCETCKDRFCVPCGHKRSYDVCRALERLMKPAQDRLMFITLTVRGLPGQSLSELIGHLRAGWIALRKLEGWRQCVTGGGVMLEIKWSETSGGHWHPHYHIICEGSWVDEAWLRKAWEVITGDSRECNVQRVREPAKALSYVAKYASKPVDSSFIRRPALLDEAMTSLKGQRLCACFGSWHGTPLQPKKEEFDETETITAWCYEGTTDDLRNRAAGGDSRAAGILAQVERWFALRHVLDKRRRSRPPDGSVAQPVQDAATATTTAAA